MRASRLIIATASTLAAALAASAQPELAATGQPLDPAAVPARGTFWSLRSELSGLPHPPLPFNPFAGSGLTVPVYALGNGQFLLDDVDVDLAVWNQMPGLPLPWSDPSAEALAAAPNAFDAAANAMGLEPLGDPPCNPGGPPYLTNLLCQGPTNQGYNLTVCVRGGTNGVPYNLFRADSPADLSVLNPALVWLGQVYTCNNYALLDQPAGAAFYRLGAPPEDDAYGTMVVAWGQNGSPVSGVPGNLCYVTAVAAGEAHCLALQSYGAAGEGTVVAWGDNTYGQSSVPAGLSNVVAVAAGMYHSLRTPDPVEIG